MTGSVPWWRRVTGRRALSWQVVVFGTLLTYPQIVLTGGTLGSRQVQPEEFPTIAAVTAVAAAVAVSLAVLAQLTFMRNRAIKPVPLWVYLSFYMTAGFIYATGMEISDMLLGTDAVVPWPIRYLFAGVTTVGWGVLISLILDAQDRFRDSRERLLDERVRLEVATLRESAEVERMRTSLDSQVREELQSGRDALNQALTSQARPEVIASLVRDTAQQSVRALSHQLHREAEQEFPRPRVTGVLRQSLARPRFLPLATTTLIAIGLPGAAIRAFGPVLAPLAIIGVAIVIFLFTRWGDLLMAAFPHGRHAIFLVVTALTVGIVLAFALVPADVPVPAAEAGSIIIGVTSAVIVAAFVAALSDVRNRVLGSLRDEVTRQHVSQTAYREELSTALRETARNLHGTVQTRLITCAAAIEKAAREGDSNALSHALDEAASILGGQSRSQRSFATICEQLSSACEPWSALCNIDVRCDEKTAHLPAIPGIDDIVEEAIANAYRHGQATDIIVEISAIPHDVLITITDNGSGPGEGLPGLGSQLIDRLTDGRFTLEELPTGARLTASVSRLSGSRSTRREFSG